MLLIRQKNIVLLFLLEGNMNNTYTILIVRIRIKYPLIRIMWLSLYPELRENIFEKLA